MDRLRFASLAAVSVVVLIALACGGGTTTAPATPAPSPIASPAAPATVEIAPTVPGTPLPIAPTVMPTPSVVFVVEDFFEAFNHGDLGALRSLYSDDIILTFGPLFPGDGFQSTAGLAAVLAVDSEHIDEHAHVTPSNVRAEVNRVTSQFSWTDEELEQRGMVPLSGSMSFIVKQGKIATIVVTFDEESKQRVAAKCFGSGPELPPDVGVAGEGTLDATLEFIRDRFNLPALGAVLIKGDRIVEMGAVGIRSFGFDEHVTTEDRWLLGSVTKAMTATVAARLVESGEVSWDTTVGSVFPDLIESIRPEYVDVRLDELLYHTAGLPDNALHLPFFSSLLSDSASDLAPIDVQRRRLAAELLALEPRGTRGRHVYSNAGYIVAGAMLEEITGKPWEELMRREVFTPLGMDSSGFGAPGTSGSRDELWGHECFGDLRAFDPGSRDNIPLVVGPAGTVHSTLSDYAKYMAAHLAGARGEGGLVSIESFEILHTPAPRDQYALGWAVVQRPWANGRALIHTGSDGKWFANVWIVPNRDFAMLAVTNTGFQDAFKATDVTIQGLIRRFGAAFGCAGMSTRGTRWGCP